MSKKLKPVFGNQFDLDNSNGSSQRSSTTEAFFSSSLSSQLVHHDFSLLGSDINSDDLEFLKSQTLLLDKTTKNFYDQIGSIFFNAQSRFVAKGNVYVFSRWYEMLGYSKSTVYLYIKRYTILSEFPIAQRTFVNDLPIRIFNKISSLDDPKKYVEMFVSGKLKTYNDLVSYLTPVNVDEIKVLDPPKNDFDISHLFSDINIKLEQKKTKLTKSKLTSLHKHMTAIIKLLED